jgi:hypothetical protein
MRDRIPTSGGIFALVLRLISAGLNIATIALLVRCSKEFGVTMEMGFAGACFQDTTLARQIGISRILTREEI